MKLKLGLAGVGLTILLAWFFLISVTVVEGDERAVVQNWNKGVLENLWTPGTHS